MVLHDAVLYSYVRFVELEGKEHDPVLYDVSPITMAQREWIGLLLLPLFSFHWAFLFSGFGFMLGFSRSPVFFDWIEKHPARTGWIHCFGPLVHFILLVASFLALRSGINSGLFYFQASDFTLHLTDGGFLDPMVEILFHLYNLNLVMFILQLLPLPAFDGSLSLMLILPKSLGQRLNLCMHQWRYFGAITAWLLFLTFGGELLRIGWELVL